METFGIKRALVIRLVPKIEGCDLERVLMLTVRLNWHADEIERLSKELNEELAKAELRLTGPRD